MEKTVKNSPVLPGCAYSFKYMLRIVFVVCVCIQIYNTECISQSRAWLSLSKEKKFKQ